MFFCWALKAVVVKGVSPRNLAAFVMHVPPLGGGSSIYIYIYITMILKGVEHLQRW